MKQESDNLKAKRRERTTVKLECFLDEDIIHWLEKKTDAEEEYPWLINHYMRKVMNNDFYHDCCTADCPLAEATD